MCLSVKSTINIGNEKYKRSVENVYAPQRRVYKDFDCGLGFVKGCAGMIYSYYYKEKYKLCCQKTITLHIFFIAYYAVGMITVSTIQR